MQLVEAVLLERLMIHARSRSRRQRPKRRHRRQRFGAVIALGRRPQTDVLIMKNIALGARTQKEVLWIAPVTVLY